MTAGGIRRQLAGDMSLGNISDIPDEAAIRVAKLWRLNFKIN
jgi:hypothetical protein